MPVLVLPLHGHLAPAAWAAAQAAPGLKVGYVQTGGGALPGSLSRDVAELRERGLLCGHITAAPTYGGEHEALSVAGALDAAAQQARLGRGDRRPGPGDHRLGDAPRPRRHGRAGQRPRRAGARPPDLALAPPLRADPRERHRGVSHHTLTVMQMLLGAVEVPVPGGRGGGDRAAGRGGGWRHRLQEAPADLRDTPPRACRPGRWGAGSRRTHSSSPRALAAWRSPRAPPCAARMGARRGRTPRMADRGQPPAPPPPPRPASRASSSTSSPTWSWSGPFPQHAQCLPHRPPPVRRVPRRARSRRARGAPGRRRRLPRRPGDRQRPARLLAATVHRKTACLRSFYKHLRRDELIGDDPTAALSAPRRAKKLPQVLNYAEVQKLLAAPRGDEPTTLRDRALLEVMYACGLRASETIGLELADVDLREGLLRARGKGPRSGSSRSAAKRSRRSPPICAAAGRSWSANATRRSCSSTSAAGRSAARASTRSFSATPAPPAWPGR